MSIVIDPPRDALAAFGRYDAMRRSVPMLYEHGYE